MEKNPYAAPKTSTDSDRRETGWGQDGVWALVGVVLLASPFLGMLGTVAGMMIAFDTLGTSAGADPAKLAADISMALMFVMWGIGLSLVGTILTLVVFYRKRNRTRWFYKSALMIGGINTALAFPVGLVTGLPVVIVFYRARAEFGA